MTLKQKRQMHNLQLKYRKVFLSSPEGREVIEDILLKNYFFNSNLVGENMTIIMGRQNAAKDIINMMVGSNPGMALREMLIGLGKSPLTEINKKDDDEDEA